MTRACPLCGAARSDSSPESGCPACLLRMGLIGGVLQAPGFRCGDTLGSWRLVSLIRRGPAASVYRAEDLAWGGDVVVKILAPALIQDEVAHHRFLLEASRRLDHAHVVPVLDSGLHQGVPYLVTPYYAGGSLADWVDATWQDEGGSNTAPNPSLDFHRIARWTRDIAAGIEYLHQQGVIHRDLKPSNILLDAAGAVRVSDFGISGPVTCDARLTPTGIVIGSPGYLAPEYGDAAGAGGTIATDIYGIGAILLELLTGAPPHSGPNLLAALSEASRMPAPAPRHRNRSVPRDLDTIGIKCLCRAPEGRYRSAGELAEDLTRFLEGKAPRATAPSALGQLVDWARRNRFTAGVLGTLLLSGLVVATISLAALHRVSEARDESHRLAEERRQEMLRLWAERGADATARHRPSEAMAWFGAAWLSDAQAGIRGPDLEAHASALEAARAQIPTPIQVVALPSDSTYLWSAAGSDSITSIGELGSISRWRGAARDASVQVGVVSNAFMGLFSDGEFLWVHGRGESNRNYLHWIEGAPEGGRRALPVREHVTDVALSADRQWLAVALASRPPAVDVWRADGEPVAVGALLGHTDRIRRVCWLGSRRVATASWDGTVRLWDWPSARPLAEWRTPEYVRDLVVDPKGRWLAFGGDDRHLHLVDLDRLAETFSIPYPGWVMRLAASADGELIAGGDRGGNVCAWDPFSGEPRMKWTRCSSAEIRRLSFNPEHSRLAIGGADQTLRIVTVADASVIVATLPEVDDRIGCVWLGEDRLASIPFAGVGVVWRISPNQRLQTCWVSPAGAEARAVSPDRRRIAAASNREVTLYDLGNSARPPTTFPLPGPPAALAFTPDSGTLHVLSKRGWVQKFEIGQDAGSRTVGTSLGLSFATALLEPSGKRWLAVTDDARLLTIDLDGRPSIDRAGRTPPQLRPGPVESHLAVSPDHGSFVLTMSPTYRLAPGTAGMPGAWVGPLPHRVGSERRLEMPGNCSGAAYSPDSSRIAAGTWEGELRIFRSADGSPVTALRHQGAPVRCVAFDRTGRVLITGSTDRHIRFWDVETGRRVSPDIEMQSSLALLHTTPSGDLLGLANDGSFGLWASRSWRPLLLHTSTDEPARRFALSDDGALLALTSKDRLLTAIDLRRTTIPLPEAALWIDLLAPFRIAASGTYETIDTERRLAAWRHLGEAAGAFRSPRD